MCTCISARSPAGSSQGPRPVSSRTRRSSSHLSTQAICKTQINDTKIAAIGSQPRYHCALTFTLFVVLSSFLILTFLLPNNLQPQTISQQHPLKSSCGGDCRVGLYLRVGQPPAWSGASLQLLLFAPSSPRDPWLRTSFAVTRTENRPVRKLAGKECCDVGGGCCVQIATADCFYQIPSADCFGRFPVHSQLRTRRHRRLKTQEISQRRLCKSSCRGDCFCFVCLV